MNKKSGSRSSLFLMEMIIAILFFSLVSAVCLRLFAKSKQLSETAANLNMAVIHVENLAELIQYARQNDSGDLEALLRMEYPDISKNTKSLLIYFDQDWVSCEASRGAYRISVTASDASALPSYAISAEATDSNDPDPIYGITLKCYRGYAHE